MSDDLTPEEPKPSKLRWVVNDVKNDWHKLATAAHIDKAEATE